MDFRDLKSKYYCVDCGCLASASVLDYLNRRGELTPCPICGGKWMHERDYRRLATKANKEVE